jgi:ubiquinone/menaquinone biosynthesis C-methylase UbiE
MTTGPLSTAWPRRYDAVWTDTPHGRAQRDLVWRHVDRLFQRGDSVLDLGCGTGEDAAHFAARARACTLRRPSAEMIRVAARSRRLHHAVSRGRDRRKPLL